ncbi:putative respiratory burst oxidase-like protein H-like [Hibiscus syriacus]|uniref:Respiratory burst oxidase-like protein H-like n=1 Tax=Hibiscus syriacus TaxID=106335 RepID=A0A6A3BLN4_HIBSY|nr:putative respiratory burst oxidase-like protein H-like [Hibiscus syriacus]
MSCPESEFRIRSNPNHASSDPNTPRGVKDDLSEFTKSLTRQFWGVVSFLAPPPPDSTEQKHEHPIEKAKSLGSPSDDPDELSDEELIGGIRNNLSEIGGKFKSGISHLSSNINVSEFTKFASNFLQFASEEDGLEKYAIGYAVGTSPGTRFTRVFAELDATCGMRIPRDAPSLTRLPRVENASPGTRLPLNAINTPILIMENEMLLRLDIDHISRHFSDGGCKLEHVLISALIERWRPETHTFHLPCGEATITLEDVSMHLGLPVDGNMMCGMADGDWQSMCIDYLGAAPPEFNGGRIALSWLKANFEVLNENASEDQAKACARAYILRIIGGILMPDKSRNQVHCMWLRHLIDFDEAGRYSWGAAVLAFLFREMCRATNYKKTAIGRCLLLLQSWVWFRMPFLCPIVNEPYVFPLLFRWSMKRKYHKSIPTGLEEIRLLIDTKAGSEFQWIPYASDEVKACIPPHLSGSLEPFLLSAEARGVNILRRRERRQPSQYHRPPTRGRREGATGSASVPPQHPYSSMPQGYMPSPPLHMPSPPVYMPSPQGYIPSPQGYIPSLQGYIPSPPGYMPSPQGFIPYGGAYTTMFNDPAYGSYASYLAGGASPQTPQSPFYTGPSAPSAFISPNEENAADDDSEDEETEEQVPRRNPPK